MTARDASPDRQRARALSAEHAGSGGRGPGRTARISRDHIADAALSLIADEGMAALTLQRVAERLGVKHSALYRHVSGRTELERIVAERFVELANWPDPVDDWRLYLNSVAESLDSQCGRIPGMMDLIYNRVWPLPTPLLAAARRSAEHLVACGFPAPLALVAVDLVADLTAEARIRSDQLSGRAEGWESVARQTVPSGTSDADTAQMDSLFSGSIVDLASVKRDIVLDGIAARLHKENSASNK
ncbi:MAG: TetR/AcrR family transcriptional regulator [Mycetocola sp.]